MFKIERIDLYRIATTILILATVLSVVMFFLVNQVFANGRHPGAKEVFAGPVDLYHVSVFSVVLTPVLHINVYVDQLENREPVNDAIIDISTSANDGAVITVRATAYPEPNNRLPEQLPYYIVNFPIQDVAEYENKNLFHMTVNSNLGQSRVQFPIDVKSPEGTIGIEIIGFAVIFLSGSAWLLFVRRKRSRKMIGKVLNDIHN